MGEIYNTRECDYNYKRAKELYGDKSAEELQKLIEEFEKNVKPKADLLPSPENRMGSI